MLPNSLTLDFMINVLIKVRVIEVVAPCFSEVKDTR